MGGGGEGGGGGGEGGGGGGWGGGEGGGGGGGGGEVRPMNHERPLLYVAKRLEALRLFAIPERAEKR